MSLSLKSVESMSKALLVRSGVVQDKATVEEVSRGEHAEVNLIRALNACLAAEGVEGAENLSPYETARRTMQAFHKVNDPNNRPQMITSQGMQSLLSNTVSTALRIGFTAAKTSYQLLSTPHSVKDLKSCVIRSLSELSTASEVPEGEAPPLASIKDRVDAVRLKKYGLAVHLSEQAIADDQLSLVTTTPAAIGRSINMKVNRLFFEGLLANPTMSEDGTSLFSVNHGNLFPAAALSEASLQVAVSAMLAQRLASPGVVQGEVGGIRPAFLVVGPSQMQTALRLCGSAYQPVQGWSIVPVAEPLVEVLAPVGTWFLFASPEEVDYCGNCHLADRVTPDARVRVTGATEARGLILDGCYYSAQVFTDYRAIVKVGA